jgi:hypothetical protein
MAPEEANSSEVSVTGLSIPSTKAIRSASEILSNPPAVAPPEIEVTLVFAIVKP